MTRDHDKRLEEQVRGALRSEDGGTSDAPLDDDFNVQLAAYLDDALDTSEVEVFEARLASNPSHRGLAVETARALHGETHPLVAAASRDSEGRDSKDHQFKGRESKDVISLAPRRTVRSQTALPLALAAGLAALVAGLWSTRQVESPDPSPASAVAQIDVAQTETTDEVDPVRRALEGHLEPVAPFASLIGPGQRPILRTSASDLGPAPMSPRWTLVSTPRPVFVWRATFPDLTGEIYLVDANETLVASLPFEGTTSPVTRLPLPDDIPDLEPGRLYAWKVNANYGESIAASDYVPFQVVAGTPPALDVSRSVDDALEDAAELAVAGRFDDAVAILATLDPDEHGLQAEPLLTAIFEQQHLFPKLNRLQRRQMGWPDNPLNWPKPPEPSP